MALAAKDFLDFSQDLIIGLLLQKWYDFVVSSSLLSHHLISSNCLIICWEICLWYISLDSRQQLCRRHVFDYYRLCCDDAPRSNLMPLRLCISTHPNIIFMITCPLRRMSVSVNTAVGKFFDFEVPKWIRWAPVGPVIPSQINQSPSAMELKPPIKRCAPLGNSGSLFYFLGLCMNTFLWDVFCLTRLSVLVSFF